MKLIKHLKKYGIGISEIRLISYLAENPNKNMSEILEHNTFWYANLKNTLKQLREFGLINFRYADNETSNRYRSYHYSLNLNNPLTKALVENPEMLKKLLEIKLSPKHITILDYIIGHRTEKVSTYQLAKKFKNIGYKFVKQVEEQFFLLGVVDKSIDTSTGTEITYYMYNPNADFSKFIEQELGGKVEQRRIGEVNKKMEGVKEITGTLLNIDTKRFITSDKENNSETTPQNI